MSTEKTRVYIENPTTDEELENNALFQLGNIEYWIITKEYEYALLKIRFMGEYVEKLIKSNLKTE